MIAWEPPDRLVLGWHLDPDWAFDPDAHSEVEIRFIPDGPHSTRVGLEHRGFEAYGERGAEVRDSVASQEGWGHLLGLYGDVVGK
ncbi:MAG: SRPBCC domain-containing protein [Nocardioidaceae bacterium]